MIKTISRLGNLVEYAVEYEPTFAFLEFCGKEYYQPYYTLLSVLAMQSDHGICVELGVEKGRGSYAMCLGGRTVYGLDHTRRGEVAVVEARFPVNFHYLETSSLPVPEEIRHDGRPISLLHVDTEHSFAQAREEFNAYRPLLAVPAVVCFDDTHAQEDQVGHFVASLRYPTIFDDRLHSCGYAVMLYTGEGM